MTRTDIVEAIQRKVGVDDDGKPGADTWSAIYNIIIGSAAPTRDVPVLVTAVQNALGITATGVTDNDTLAAVAASLSVDTGSGGDADAASGDIDNSPVDARSEGVISHLQPQVQPLARTLVHKAAAQGITIKVISGLRTYAEQDALYAEGRTIPGTTIVTNATAGHSNHNFGLAFDIGVFDGIKYIDESPDYKTVGAIGVSIGLTWGGNWTSIQDEPHFELRPTWAANLDESDMLAALRQRKANNQDFFA